MSMIIEIGDPRNEATWSVKKAGDTGANLAEAYNPLADLRAEMRKQDNGNLLEAFVNTPDATNMLRDGIRYLAFSRYNGWAPTWDAFTMVEASSKPQEEYLRDATMGTLPRTPSGEDAPLLTSNFEGAVTIKNFRYAGLVEVTGDDIRFDRLGKIRQIAAELGRSARTTEEDRVYRDITTTGNYTRSNTTNDNDVGANQQTLTFNGVNFETACTIISTAKDRRSGNYLGLMPDTIIIGPRMEVPVKQLLLSGDLNRVGGNTTNEVRGMGSLNQYRGMISRIVISPWFSNSYAWALVDSRVMSYVFQRVEPFNVFQEAQNATSEAWLVRDVTRYLAQGYFGTGFVDDRAWFYSDSSTAPTVS